MIPTKPALKYPAGARVKVVQTVRVGGMSWLTEVVGVIEGESHRPIGGMEMGVKSLVTHQPTLRLRKDDGEITVVAIDEHSSVTTLDGPTN